MGVPVWVQDSVFYQIFPDRFANGDQSNDPPNLQNWGAEPTIWGFQGGDIQGIIERLDYLTDLGINALYINPIFLSTSNHRYNTTDYYTIDPKLGTLATFRDLVDGAHHRGIRIVLDGVFNHCGRGFFAFDDVLENQEHSPYIDWFHIKQFPLEAYQPGDAKHYQGWWKYKSLPKFNTDNPLVRRYIYDVARYWIEQGADGWRLDVPSEIDDDPFWSEFRRVVKAVNPEVYLVGEIWKVDPRWVGPGHFDGLMNYPLREALIALIETGKLSTEAFAEQIKAINSAYPLENSLAHYVPLGSHDTARLATLLAGDQRKLRLCYAIQFCYPGAPAIYYGDEIGLFGGEDPGSRRAFPWDESLWDSELRDYIKQLIALRHQYIELRRGSLNVIVSDPAGAIGMARTYEGSTILLAFNPSGAPMDVRLPVNEIGWGESQRVEEIFNHQEQHIVSEGKIGLHLPPFRALVLRSST